MNRKKIDWQGVDREYFELWDWIFKECDGDWTKTYRGRCPQKAEEHRIKTDRFSKICQQIDEREQSYYFCWMKTINAWWSRHVYGDDFPQNDVRWHNLCASKEPIHEIDCILRRILGPRDRYYWFVSLFSALPESTNDKEARRSLKLARDAYRLRHHQYSDVFDLLLGISDGFTESLKILREYLRGQLKFHEQAPVEVACDFTAIRVDTVSRKRASIIDAAATKGLESLMSDFLIPDFLISEQGNERKGSKQTHCSFFFCETDFIYPHCRRLYLVPQFCKFNGVAAVDYFYKYHIDLEDSELTRWPDETTHIIDRWSKEHVDTFKDFFTEYAEEENEKWRCRFDAGIDSESPDVSEKYLKHVYRIGILPSSAESKNMAPPASLGQTTRTKKKQVKRGTRPKPPPTKGKVHFALCTLFLKNEAAVHYTAQRLYEVLKEGYKLKRCSPSAIKASQAWHEHCAPLRRKKIIISVEDAGQIPDNHSKDSETDQY